MAVASPVVCALEPIERLRRHDFGAAGLVESGGWIKEESPRVVEEKVYVAVGKDVKDCISVLLWALQNSGGKKICLLHVHQPPQMIPLMGTKFPANKLKEEEVRAFRQLEKAKMHQILNEYVLFCATVGVRADKLDIEMDNVEQGIVELVARHGIRRLVMGASADKHYSKKLTMVKSKKAIFVNQQANESCLIRFICKGYLIHTREGSLDEAEVGFNASPIASPLTETVESDQLRSKSKSPAERQCVYRRLRNHVQDFLQRVGSAKVDSYKGRVTTSSSPKIAGEMLASPSRLDARDGAIELGTISTRSPSQGSGNSICSLIEVIGSLDSMSLMRDEESVDGALLSPVHEEDLCSPSPQGELEARRVDDVIHSQPLQVMAEAESSKREAFEESLSRQKAEISALEAIHIAKSAETLHASEMKWRKVMEDALARGTLELKTMKSKLDEVFQELQITLDQKSTLENQIAESDQTVKELEEKLVSAAELLLTVRKQRDEMVIERDGVVREAEELRKRIEETACSQRPLFLIEFSLLEIEEATHNFDTSLMTGEGGYGCVYRGLLRNTEVAIKVLRSNSLQGCSEFQQEVDVLSRVRHPNIVILIGACSQAGSLIYEYLPNGSLEDRLTCKDHTPPLSWQTRIRIATEIYSALIFLHSNKPYSIIHGDLKPSNILLDANGVGKLSDFGICRLVASDNGLTDTCTACWRTTPKGTFAYMDPEFFTTGELTLKSDVYAFGIILMRLLTGKSAMGIVKKVEYGLEKGNLSVLLDESAGDWPFVQAKQLAHLALRCCEMRRKSRPDLKSDVWRVLEPMKASFGSSSSFRLEPMEQARATSYFVCPIFQEIMRDPHTAADGYTYEGEAMRGWLDSGNDTSPMTGLKLAHHNLIPNHAIRSAIHEWLEQR